MNNKKGWHNQFIKAVGVNIWAPEWYHDSIRNFDADKLTELLANINADAGITFQGFSQDHFGASFFPTELGHTHCNLNGRDHLAMYQKAVKAIGAKFFAYYSYQDKSVWDRNPDWRVKNSNGETPLDDNFGMLCPNSPYREHLVMRITEIAEKYKPDGWLMDTMSVPFCYCDYCRRKYRMTVGRALPTGEPDCGEGWFRFKRWRYDCLTEMYSNIVTAIKRITPDSVMMHNAFMLWNYDEWKTGEDHEAMMALDDVTTNIYACDYGAARSPDTLWKAGYYTRVFRGVSDKPVWMQFGRFMYNRDYTSLPEQEIAMTAFSERV